MLLSVGAGGLTVNTTAEVVPPAVVMVTFAGPVAASAAMANVAVIWVLLATTTLLMVTPGFPILTVAPEAKFVPVSVTGTVVPCTPLVGLILLSVGRGGRTVKITAAEIPPAVVTVTFAGPIEALAEMFSVAVI
jgi:hypothetical protein